MNKAKRKAVIAGNWKMNKTATEAASLIDALVPAVQGAGCDVVICTPFTSLCTAVEKCAGTNIGVGAENEMCIRDRLGAQRAGAVVPARGERVACLVQHKHDVGAVVLHLSLIHI